MTAKHRDVNPSSSDHENDQEDEKLFDFDKSFDEGAEDFSNESETERVSELETALSDSKEKYLRLLAEFDNYKKRTSKERIDLLGTASKNVLLALLPVLDDFERAMKSMESVKEDILLDGVRMIYSRLVNVVQSQGLKAMESNGAAFDPDFHEAITEAPVTDPSQKGKVIETIEKGYMLHDKIIRHAKVVVGKAE